MRFTKVVFALFLTFISTGIPLISQDIGLLRNPDYSIITPCYNNRCLVQDNSRKWYIIDLSDDSSVPLEIDRLINFQYGMIVYKRDKRYGMMTLDQEQIIDRNGDDVAFLDANLLPHSSFHDGYAVVASFALTKERLYSGLINRQGELVIDFTYEGIDYIENGFFRACRPDGIDIIKDGKIYFSFLEISRGITTGIQQDDYPGVRNHLEYIIEDHILGESGLKYLKLKIFALFWLQEYEEAILLLHDYADYFPEEQSLHDACLVLEHYMEDSQTDLYCDFIFPKRLKSSGNVSRRWWEE